MPDSLPDFIPDSAFVDPQATPALPDFIPDSAFVQAPRQRSAFERYVYDPAGQILQGLTFGAGDELTALAGQGLGRDYEQELAGQRADNAMFEQEHPYASVGLQLAGALAPTVLSGGGGAAASGGRLSQLLRSLYGVGKVPAGLPAAARIGRAAGTGAVQGGLYGYGTGEGGAGQRLVNAGQSAIAGGVIGGGIGTGAAAIDAAVTSRPAQALFGAMGQMSDELAAEGGKVGGGAAAPASVNAADLAILRKLRDKTPEQLEFGEQEMAQAVSEGSPLWLAEALKSPRLTRQARAVANSEASMDFAQNAIEERAKSGGARATQLLDELSPERDPFEGAGQFRRGAEDVTEKVRGARRQMSKPLYERAEEVRPIIDSPEVSDALTSRTVKGIIKDIKEEFPAQYGDLPDNHIRVLDKVKKRLDAEINAKKQASDGSRNADVIRDLEARRDQLVGAIDNAGDEYKSARDMFRAFSGPVNYLEGQAREPGLLTRILKTNDGNVLSAVTSTFNQNANPARVASIREAMEIGGKGAEFKAGVRSFLQHIVNSTDDGKRAVRDFIDNEAQRNILKAALGDSYDSFARKIERETRIFEGKKAYHAGSSTAGNLAEAADLRASSGVGRAIRAALSPRQTAIDAADAAANWIASLESRDAGLAQSLSRALFSGPEGLETLRRIRPMHRRVAEIGQRTNQAERLGVRGSAAAPRKKKK